jgi:hypothetical protein
MARRRMADDGGLANEYDPSEVVFPAFAGDGRETSVMTRRRPRSWTARPATARRHWVLSAWQLYLAAKIPLVGPQRLPKTEGDASQQELQNWFVLLYPSAHSIAGLIRLACDRAVVP